LKLAYNLRFPGQYFDAESGLHFNWMRYYDPITGRYESRDPVESDNGRSFYTYVNNDTLNWLDPYGQKGIKALIINLSEKAWNHILERHVKRNKFPHKSKFKKPCNIKKDIKKVLDNPDKITIQVNGRVVYEKDLGRKIGTEGETIQRVVTEKNGDIVTTFPSDAFTAAALIGLIGSLLDPLDMISGDLADDGSDML